MTLETPEGKYDVVLTFKKETKNSVVYVSEEFGGVYVPRTVLREIAGPVIPVRLSMTLEVSS